MSRADIDEWADWIDAEDVYRKMKIAPRTLQTVADKRVVALFATKR
jgi:hypothetical protein